MGFPVQVLMSWHEAAASPRSRLAAGSLFQGISFSHGSTPTAVQKTHRCNQRRIPYTAATTRTTNKITTVTLTNFSLCPSSQRLHPSEARRCNTRTGRDNAAPRGRGASEWRRAPCASPFRRLSASLRRSIGPCKDGKECSSDRCARRGSGPRSAR